MKKLHLIFIPVMTMSILTGCNKKSLENYTWKEIQEISKNNNASKTFKVGDTKRVQLKTQDLNNNGKIDDGEYYQTVRIIGFNHDFDENSKVIGITFEFADKICDPAGLSLSTYWNDFEEKPETAYDAALHYHKSSVRAALIGEQEEEGYAELNWYRYYGIIGETAPKSLNYYFIKESTNDPCYKKSVLDMLPDDLKNAITPAMKLVNEYKRTEGGTGRLLPEWIEDPLFLLTPREVGYDDEDVKQEPYTQTYQYYQGHTELKDSIRIKTQMNNEEANEVEKNVLDGNYRLVHGGSKDYTSYSYAGCRTNPSQCMNLDWLRTPQMWTNSSCAYCIDDRTGRVDSHNVRQYACNVSPAFCI